MRLSHCFCAGVMVVAIVQQVRAADPAIQFYSDGKTINGWIRVPERSYDMTWHFFKATDDTIGWSQELAVKYYTIDDKIFYWDIGREREFKGYYDAAKGKYFRLPPQFRRPLLQLIRPEWFQELDDMPFLRNLAKHPCVVPDVTSGNRLEPPPESLAPPKEWLEQHGKKAA